MKILQVHNRYRIDGGENVMFDVTKAVLEQNGHSVATFERDSRNVGMVLPKKVFAAVSGAYCRANKAMFASILHRERPDVVHVHNLYPLISPSVLVACREYGLPVVMRCPNYRMVCPTSFQFRDGSNCDLCSMGREYWCILKNCRKNIAESVAYALRSAVARKKELFTRDVTVCIAPSEFVKKRLEEGGFFGPKFVVIPNPVRLPSANGNYSEGRYAAYAGRISPEKGVDTLLEAASRTRVPVLIAGDTSGASGVVRMAPPNVKFLGHLSSEELDDFYSYARFLLIPSRWHEPFGLVAVEAMDRGLPIIASMVGGLQEIVDDAVTGYLVEPGDAMGLAEKMQLLWENPGLCREMGREGKRKARHMYSREQYYKGIMTAYSDAIAMFNSNRNQHAPR